MRSPQIFRLTRNDDNRGLGAVAKRQRLTRNETARTLPAIASLWRATIKISVIRVPKKMSAP